MIRLNSNTSKKIEKNNLRILFGPIHIAGNFIGYSQGLKELGISSRIVLTEEHPFKYEEENLEYLNKKIKLHKISLKVVNGKIFGGFNFLSNYQFLKFIDQFDIFHFTFGKSLLPENQDVPIIKAKGKKIVMQFCGCDIRCREIIMKEKRQTSVCDDCKEECHLRAKKDLAQFWENNADAIISHPEYSQLLTKKYYPFIIGIDTKKWKGISGKKESKTLVVHAPSSPQWKGTKYIIEAINLLKSERDDFEFKLLSNMSNEEVKKTLIDADVVVDQLMCGWYGHLAVESMALGKPVLCHLEDKWCEKAGYAMDAPIVRTTKENIYENLKKLLDDPNLRKNIGIKSRIYVENIHDYKKVARSLLDIYQNITF